MAEPPPGPEKTRRIVQIAVSNGGGAHDDTLVALCNDGTVWVMVWGKEPGAERWVKMIGMPQD